MKKNQPQLTTCLATNCSAKLQRGRHACFIHWQALDADLQRRLRSARGPSAIGAVRIEAASYLDDRMKGSHQITHCRSCAGDIIFLLSDNGRHVPIDANLVDAADTQYDHAKHVRHLKTCPRSAFSSSQ